MTRHRRGAARPARSVDRVHLCNAFAPQALFSDDEVAALHDAALDVLESLGMRILLPEARALFWQAGPAWTRRT